MAQRVSTNVIKGVSVTSLEGAKALVAAGQAKKEDFWVTVGYSGWAPGQLQNEVERLGCDLQESGTRLFGIAGGSDCRDKE